VWCGRRSEVGLVAFDLGRKDGLWEILVGWVGVCACEWHVRGESGCEDVFVLWLREWVGGSDPFLTILAFCSGRGGRDINA